MSQPASSPGSTLPTEVLVHILRMSQEGQAAGPRQSQRITFGGVCRAWFLASIDSTEFSVQGEQQAKAFVAKLARERKWAAQEERKASSGRTTRASLAGLNRPSTVRRLTVHIDRKAGGRDLAALITACPRLASLTLSTSSTLLDSARNSSLLEAALGSLESLHELTLEILGMVPTLVLLKLVAPLPTLRVLDSLGVAIYDREPLDPAQLERLASPHLQSLAFNTSHSTNNGLLLALATGSRVGLRTVQLGDAPAATFSTIFDSVLPLLSTVTHFAWVPYDGSTLTDDQRATVAKVFTGLTNVEVLDIATLEKDPLGPSDRDDETWDKPAIVDPAFYAAIQTLSKVRELRCTSLDSKVDEDDIISLIGAMPSLRVLTLAVVFPPWTDVQRARVSDAAEVAGVEVVYDQSDLYNQWMRA